MSCRTEEKGRGEKRGLRWKEQEGQMKRIMGIDRKNVMTISSIIPFKNI